jgi:acyl-coenzyme A synthetase/AMP-(fatty) acid ligase
MKTDTSVQGARGRPDQGKRGLRGTVEIEKCLETHEAVRECVVMGLKDSDGLLKTKAFISVRDGYECGMNC